MSNDENSVLANAATEILGVSSELAKLRGAVESHGHAAEALAQASDELKQLAQTVATLPSGFAVQFERGAQVVGAIETALAPAGELRTGVLQVNERFAEVATSRELGEAIAQLEHCITERTEGLGANLERSLTNISGSMAGGLDEVKATAAGLEQLVLSRLESVESRLKTVEEGIATLASKLMGLEVGLEKQASLISRCHEQTTAQFSTLERLARRSLIAILMGKDVPAK